MKKQTVIGDPMETGKQWLNHHDEVDYVNLKTNHHYTESKEDLIKGVNRIADVVKVTLGAKGKNVLFNNRDGKPQITKDGITAARQVFSMNPFENMAIQIVREASEQTVKTSGDGPQPLYSKVLTPNGFTTMGELKVGDEICGTNGTTQKVLGVYPKGEKEIYKVHFSDGRIVECCNDHLWNVTSTLCNTPKNITMSVQDMIDSNKIAIKKNGFLTYGYYTPKTIVNFKESKLPLDPYLLGVLLGDGTLSDSGDIEISLGINKEHIIDKLILPENTTISVKWNNDKSYFRIKISKEIKKILDDLGLYKTNSYTKHIPFIYLYSSIDSRKALLQGLLDTDGYINDRGLFEFSTVSDSLKDDFMTLTRSLGYSLYYKLHTRENDKDSYSNKSIHRIYQLKGYKYGDKIVKIEATGEFTEMQCIKVSNPDSLYITDNFIITHNTTTTIVLARYIINKGFELLNSGKISYYELSKQLDEVKNIVIEEIQNKSLSIEENFDKLLHIATISSSSENIGKFIYDIMEEIGIYGSIEVKSSNKTKDVIDKVKGIKIHKGFYAPHFVNDRLKMEYRMNDVGIVLIDDTVRSFHNDILPYIELEPGRPIVFFVNDIEPTTLQTIINNKVANPTMFNIMFVEHDGFGDRRIEIMNDIAAMTGATVGDANDFGEIGFAKEIIVNEDSTSILGGSIDEETVNRLVEETQYKLNNDELDEDQKRYYRRRLATLKGGVAVIHVGGMTEVEMKEKKDRIDDAVEAVKSAIDRGISVGGGYTFIKINNSLCVPNEGGKIIKDSLLEPFKQLCINADTNYEGWLKIISNHDKTGYDVIKNDVVSLDKYNVYDPTGVLIDSLSNAVAVAKSILSVECSLYNY
jgi:chaperonin GroEL